MAAMEALSPFPDIPLRRALMKRRLSQPNAPFERNAHHCRLIC